MKQASHTVIGIAALVALFFSPTSVHAGVISSFTDKVKAMFVEEKEESPSVLATSQTMELFKPTIVDGTTTDGADLSATSDQESLQAVSGPMRVSTEDIDFPTTDTISVYEVKKGDTIEEIAKLFNVSVNTIMWANNLTSRAVTKGTTLIILPITGIKHSVKKGDTIASVARKYNADAGDVASYNGVSVGATLTIGDTILVPEGEIEVIQPKVAVKSKSSKIVRTKVLDVFSYSAPGDFFVRPVNGGRRTQGIHGHNGIDIAATPGTPVLAAATGRVIAVKVGGYNGGYGNMIIIAHDKGIQTVYAHLRSVSVITGQSVTRGEQIGELGNTGRSTGPHLHFEVRGAKNPF